MPGTFFPVKKNVFNYVFGPKIIQRKTHIFKSKLVIKNEIYTIVTNSTFA